MDASLPSLLAQVTTFYVGCTCVGLALGFGLERALPGRRIFADPLSPGQLAHELRGNVTFVAIAVATTTAALATSAIRFDAGSSAVATFFAMHVGFQLWFYGMHRALHHPSLVRFHRHHHVSVVTTPLSGQSTSAAEALGWMVGYVGLPILLSRVAPLSSSGLLAYLAFNVVGNVMGHANVEIVARAPGLRVRSLVATVFTYHALHHLRWNGHFGFEATWTDRLFGTEYPDWIPLYEQVTEGHALRCAEVRTPRAESAA